MYKTLQLNEANFILRKKGITLVDRNYSFYKIRVKCIDLKSLLYSYIMYMKDFGQRVVQCMLILFFFVTGINYRVVLFCSYLSLKKDGR